MTFQGTKLNPETRPWSLCLMETPLLQRLLRDSEVKRQVRGLQSIRNEVSAQEGKDGAMIGFVLSSF